MASRRAFGAGCRAPNTRKDSCPKYGLGKRFIFPISIRMPPLYQIWSIWQPELSRGAMWRNLPHCSRHSLISGDRSEEILSFPHSGQLFKIKRDGKEHEDPDNNPGQELPGAQIACVFHNENIIACRGDHSFFIKSGISSKREVIKSAPLMETSEYIMDFIPAARAAFMSFSTSPI
mgnify:CR=1 FL=1